MSQTFSLLKNKQSTSGNSSTNNENNYQGEYFYCYYYPLHWAVRKSIVKEVESLLAAGFDINSTDKFGRTALHWAVLEEKGVLLDILLSKGALVNVRDGAGETPLHYAVHVTNTDIIRKLLNHGADINYPDTRGNTVLHKALGTKEHVRVVEFLLESGADANAQNTAGYTALHKAVFLQREKSIEILLSYGARVDIVDKINCIPLFYYQSIVGIVIGRDQFFEVNINYDYNQLRNALRNPDDLKPSRIIKETVVKYETMGFKVGFPVNKQYYEDSEGFIYKDFKDACAAELKRMRSKKLSNVSLSDVVLSYNDPSFASNKTLERFIKSSDFKKEFPIFSFMLILWLRRAKIRNTLMNGISISAGVESKNKMYTKIQLPNELSRKITTFLSNDEIVNVKEAFNC